MTRLSARLNLHRIGDNYFLNTFGDGNCGVRAAIQSILIQGFLNKKRVLAATVIEEICARSALHGSEQLNTFIRKYKNCNSLQAFEEFMFEYSKPAWDDEERGAGDQFLTAICITLLDNIREFSMEHLIQFVDFENREGTANQFDIGQAVNMEYAIPYFSENLGVNLVIKQRDRVNQYQALPIGVAPLNTYILHGNGHYDAFVPHEDLQTYDLTLPREPLLYRFLGIDSEARPDRLLQSLYDLCEGKKYATLTNLEVRNAILAADAPATHDLNSAPMNELVAKINAANQRPSIFGYTSTILDAVCDFVLKIFGYDRETLTKQACTDFRKTIVFTQEPEPVRNTLTPNNRAVLT